MRRSSRLEYESKSGRYHSLTLKRSLFEIRTGSVFFRLLCLALQRFRRAEKRCQVRKRTGRCNARINLLISRPGLLIWDPGLLTLSTGR